jgi:GAF domain
MLHHWETRIRSRDDSPRGRSLFEDAAGAQVVRVAVSLIEGCDAAGLFTVADEAVMTIAWTDNAIVELDQVQFEHDEGPCLDAVCEGYSYWTHDLAFDPRWPTFGARALEFGLRSTLAVPLSVPGIFALALYSRAPGVFNDVVRAQSSLFATNATAALIPGHRSTRRAALST